MKICIEPIALAKLRQMHLERGLSADRNIVPVPRSRLSPYRMGLSDQYYRRVALLLVTAIMGWSIIVSPVAAQTPVNVVERGYNPLRTGANTAETALTPANVRSAANQFHRRFVMPVDGKIEGWPLYVSGVNIGGVTHNVLYVATMHDSVFAFDADTGAQLAARSLGRPVLDADLHALKPDTIHSEWGIAGTPVIDQATGTLYTVRWGYEDGISGPTFRLFGLDISNLDNDKFAPALIDGYNVGGTPFNRHLQMQRAGLALAKKPDGSQAVVVAFGGGEG